MDEIDKSEEYQQVAALVCLDMDMLADISNDSTITLEDLKAQIKHFAAEMKKYQEDAEYRKMRYNACCVLFNLTGV